ncbi:hypothetical protein KUTeg_022861 [Tegillarca granosa]|uniref:SCP domain-containing protein n=1 Tax=Tegillarca granosa TaxID=220873 RepID=A0ABQ9E337_TEGGR|nr:hypothetical protein KUTeg_022861 [Tegillarca granosa]
MTVMSVYNEKIYQFYILIVVICHLNIVARAENIKDTRLRYKRATRECHRKYQTITGHTACLPRSSKVVDTGVSIEDKARILNLHNDARRNVNPTAVAMLLMDGFHLDRIWLGDCGSKVCLNFGEMDPDTCTCSCMKYPHYVGNNCALYYLEVYHIIQSQDVLRPFHQAWKQFFLQF